MRRTSVSLIMGFPLCACVAPSHSGLPAIPDGYHFSYRAEQADVVGLLQVFDDGAKTYLEFRQPCPAMDIRNDTLGPTLPQHCIAPYVTVDGLYPQLLLTIDHQSASVFNDAKMQGENSVAPSQVPQDSSSRTGTQALVAHSPADAAGTRVLNTVSPASAVESLHVPAAPDDDELPDPLDNLSGHLTSAHQVGAALNVTLRAAANATRLIVRFEPNSADPSLAPTLLAPLGNAARAAGRIYVHGYTDASKVSAQSTSLALRRAVAMRQILIAQHVPSTRVRLFYHSAGSVPANNDPPEGRAENRRVEIELLP